MKKWIFGLLPVFVLCVVLIWRLIHPSGVIGLELLFGWGGFLIRVLPQIEIRGDGVAILAIGLLGIVGIGHYLLRWLARETASNDEQAAPAWRWRSTIAISFLVVVMFVTGVAMIGVTHQVAWLIQDDQPLFGTHVLPRNPSVSKWNLKSMALSSMNYADVYGTLPTHWGDDPSAPKHSWVTRILPWVPYQTESIDMSRPWDDPVNAPNFRVVLREFCNPGFRTPQLRDARGFALNHYAGNRHIFESTKKSLPNFYKVDTSNTLLFGEVNSDFVPWGQPNNSRDPARGINTLGGFGGASADGSVMFVMADGSIRTFDADTDPSVLQALSTPSW